jgi:hypothetical protein
MIVAHTGDMISADVAFAKTAHVASLQAAHVASLQAAHVASLKATHVAAAKSTPHVATATTATTSSSTSSLRTRSKKAPGEHRACQNHHHSSSHDFLHLVGRTCRHRTIVKRCSFTKVISNVAMKGRWECRSVVSTKFSFNQQNLCGPTNACRLAWRAISLLRACCDASGQKSDGAHRPHEGDEVGCAPSTRQPHDIASGDRRGCAGRDLGV